MSKLSETQLIVLSTAAQHDNGIAALPDQLSGRAAVKVVKPLLSKGFLEELPATPGMPAWRREQDGDRSYALIITSAGRAAINIEPDEQAESGTDADRGSAEAAAPAPRIVASNRKPAPDTIVARAAKRKHRANQKESQVSKARASLTRNKQKC
jgi:hypothetical protein